MNDQVLVDEVLKFIKGLAQNTVSRDIAADTEILSGHIVDSLGIIELISFIQSRYYIKMEQADLTIENLDSAQRIARYIKSRQK